MTLNGIMAVILCYSTEFGRFGANYIKVAEDPNFWSQMVL